jgi:hypothetical protein
MGEFEPAAGRLQSEHRRGFGVAVPLAEQEVEPLAPCLSVGRAPSPSRVRAYRHWNADNRSVRGSLAGLVPELVERECLLAVQDQAAVSPAKVPFLAQPRGVEKTDGSASFGGGRGEMEARQRTGARRAGASRCEPRSAPETSPWLQVRRGTRVA